MSEQDWQSLLTTHNDWLDIKGTISASLGVGFRCKSGWHSLIERALTDTGDLIRPTGRIVRLLFVRATRGGIYVHCNPTFERVAFHYVMAIWAIFEERTRLTCEVCGEAGTTAMQGDRNLTLCDAHARDKGVSDV
jgi:hypothetical protein